MSRPRSSLVSAPAQDRVATAAVVRPAAAERLLRHESERPGRRWHGRHRAGLRSASGLALSGRAALAARFGLACERQRPRWLQHRAPSCCIRHRAATSTAQAWDGSCWRRPSARRGAPRLLTPVARVSEGSGRLKRRSCPQSSEDPGKGTRGVARARIQSVRRVTSSGPQGRDHAALRHFSSVAQAAI